MIAVKFEATDGETMWATGESLEKILKGLHREHNDKQWTIRTLEVVKSPKRKLRQTTPQEAGKMKDYVVCTSNRSREKVHQLVGDGNHEEYYHESFKKDFHLTEIPSNYLKQALEITGVRKGKFTKEWHKCWKQEKVLGPSETVNG